MVTMHTTKKLVLSTVAAAAAGLVLGFLLTFLFAGSAAGQAAIRQYFLSTSIDSVPPAPESASSVLQSATSTILVPKSYAGQSYYESLNATVASYNAVAGATTQLAPILVDINNRAAKGNFDGILDRIITAKLIVAQARAATAAFGKNLSTLAAVNQSTRDASTRSLTNELIPLGTTLRADLDQGWELTDRVLSGPVPTANLIAESEAMRKKVLGEAAAFTAKVGELSIYLVADVQGLKR